MEFVQIVKDMKNCQELSWTPCIFNVDMVQQIIKLWN
jgi:hypothetical protein